MLQMAILNNWILFGHYLEKTILAIALPQPNPTLTHTPPLPQPNLNLNFLVGGELLCLVSRLVSRLVSSQVSHLLQKQVKNVYVDSTFTITILKLY